MGCMLLSVSHREVRDEDVPVTEDVNFDHLIKVGLCQVSPSSSFPLCN